MSDFVKVAALNDLPVGQSKCVDVNGREVALFNLDGKIFAIDNCCPHRGGPLAEGMVEGCQVICPWHGWRFDVTTGAGVTIANKPVDAYDVRVENGEIWVSSAPRPQSV